MTDENKTKIFIWLLSAITVLAFAMRFPYLGISPLGDDEAVTVFYASRDLIPWEDFLWSSMVRNGFPPLDFILNHFVFSVFGVSQATSRYLPTFFDTFSVFLIGMLGCQLCNRKTGIIVAFLWALSPCTIYYAKEARLYAHLDFAVILYLLSLAICIKKTSWQRMLFVFFSLVYGFNVSILFIFAIMPSTVAILLYYIFSNIGNNRDNIISQTKDFVKITIVHFLGAFAVFTFYKFYNTIAIVGNAHQKTAKAVEMYSLSEFFERFLIRIEDALYMANWAPSPKKGIYLLIIPTVIFVISLFWWRKDVLLKLFVSGFLLLIPVFDVISLYRGGKFVGWTAIRHIYVFVPLFYLGFAYSYNCLFDFIQKFADSIANTKYLGRILALVIVCILLISFDAYALSVPRKNVQNVRKGQYDIFYNWLDKKSSLGKVMVVDRITDRRECRMFSYLCAFDYNHSSNIFYRVPATVYRKSKLQENLKKEVHQINKIDDKVLIEVLNNKLLLAFAYSNKDAFPYDKLIFEKLSFEKVALYYLKPIQNVITHEQFSAYEHFFGNIFTNQWHGRFQKFTPKLISCNSDFSDNINNWNYWKVNEKYGEKHISVDFDEKSEINYLHIQTDSGKLFGVVQPLNLKENGIYKLSGKARGYSEEEKGIFGGQIVVNLPQSKARELTFRKSSDWTYQELIFTNQNKGIGSVLIRIGYNPHFKGTGDFTDVKLEELIYEDINDVE